MKQLKLMLLILTAMFAQNNLAQTKVKIGDLYYNLSGAIAAVACSQPQGTQAYAGGASLYTNSFYSIPEVVTYEGFEYTLNSATL